MASAQTEAAQKVEGKFSGQLSPAGEGRPASADGQQGGWKTFFFVTGTAMGAALAGSGCTANLIVYLIEKFNVKSVDATQISNVVSGCINLFPVAGAIVADSFVGCFSVIIISSFALLLGIAMLTLTAMVDSLRPLQCPDGSLTCETPSKLQYAFLYSAITVTAIGIGGARFNIATMGADQFDKASDQGVFFNWYFFTLYSAFVIACTAIVYVQDNVSWGWGFGICFAALAMGLAIFLMGNRHYRKIKPQGSPFTSIPRVIIATILKRKLPLSPDRKDYYYGDSEGAVLQSSAPSSSFRFINRAAILKTESGTESEGSWRLCTVEQVEDFKTLIRIFPLWSTSFFLSTPIGIQSSLTVLQALTMDRHIGPHFKIPAASFLVFSFLSSAIFLSILDRFLFPMWQKLTCRHATPLQAIGVGHIINIVGMAGSALVEWKRLHVARLHHLVDEPGSIVPMSALWLVVPLAIVGIGEAFHFPGQVSLYYQEFPASLRGTAVAMISLSVGIGFYLSTAVVDLVRRATRWLPDNINKGRLDNAFLMLVVIGVINFGYYLACAKLYKYQNVEKEVAEQDEAGLNSLG